MEQHSQANQLKGKYQNREHQLTQKKVVYFAGMPKNLSRDDLIDYFNRFGLVLSSSFMKFKEHRRPQNSQERHRGCGTVTFRDSNSAKKAAMADNFYKGEEILVRYFYSEQERREMEMRAVAERRKIHVDGVPYGFRRGK